MEHPNTQKLEQISHAGIVLDANGDIHDNLGHPAGRKGPRDQDAPSRRRVTYDSDDDSVLQGWVLKARSQGLQPTIKIFEDLESINPRHTAQSWQARWKKLFRRADPQVPTAANGAPSLDSDSFGQERGDNIRSMISSTEGVTDPGNNITGEELPRLATEDADSAIIHTDRRKRIPGASENEAGIGEAAVTGSSANALYSCSPEQRQQSIHNDDPSRKNEPPIVWSLPATPFYPAVQSRKVLGQIKAIEWMTLAGRQRFEAQEAQLLSRWGVTAEHEGTCILVPKIWSGLDPATAIPLFDYEVYSGLDNTRLNYSMLDHSTSWARAAAWFKGSPHNGLEFDNFLGSGPFRPMEGSHLCHHGNCINPHHVVYEDARINEERMRCCSTAQDLRSFGLQIPEHCLKHKQTPCLLQHAALTTFEVYLIQFSILRQARGLPPLASPVAPPADHSYATFETSLPVSFINSVITLNPAHITSEVPVTTIEPSPLFHCNHCTTITSFRSLQGFWAHIRDGHPLVSNERRLNDIQRAGQSWQAYKELGRDKGSDIKQNDTTWKQVEQMRQEDFDWNVVLGWKLAYSRKRKYGRPTADDSIDDGDRYWESDISNSGAETGHL